MTFIQFVCTPVIITGGKGAKHQEENGGGGTITLL